MKFTVEVEPVILQGTIKDQNYYGFKIIGLKDRFGDDLVATSSGARYPGNDVVRDFINSRSNAK